MDSGAGMQLVRNAAFSIIAAQHPYIQMSYKVLARKWRPQHFRDMIGQEPVLRALVNALDSNRLHHAYLFTGMRGVGKTTIARIFAKCLNCETNGVSASPCGECSSCRDIEAGRFIDLIEVDAASRTKVEETRELLENVPYAPASGRYKVYLIDEVHMFSNHSFNALLKTLEEPPEHVKFLLATTDPQKVPVTVLSRCLQFNLRRMAPDTLAEYLSTILVAESIEHERPALNLIARASEGSVRDALSLIEQAAAYGDGNVRESDVESMLGRASVDRLLGLIESLGASDMAQLFERIEQLAEYAPDFSELMGEMLSLLHRIAMLQSVPGSVAENTPGFERLSALAQSLAADEVQLFYQIGMHARRDMPFAPDPREAFDMALLRMNAFRPQGDQGSLVSVSKSATTALPTSVSDKASGGARAQQQTRQKDAGTDVQGKSPTKPVTDVPTLAVRGEVSAGGSLRAAALAAARGEPLGATAPSGKSSPVTPQVAQQVSRRAPQTQGGVVTGVEQGPVARKDAAVSRPVQSASASPSIATDSPKALNTATPREVAASPSVPLKAGAPQTPNTAISPKGPEKPAANADESPQLSGAQASVPESASAINKASIQPTDWHQVVAELDISGMPRQLASHTELLGDEGNRLRLRLQTGSEHLNVERFVERVQTALSQWLERDVKIIIDMVDGTLNTPASIDAQKSADELAAARISIKQDPLVQQLIDQVDAAIDEDSIQPIRGQ